MVIYSVMQSVEWFCSFLSNSSMLLEKSNNYSGTLLFHAAGIVDLWYAPSGCPFCRASLQRYYNADKYNRHNHEHCHVTIQKCPYVTAKQRFYTFLPNKQKPPFVPNSTKSGFYRLISRARSLAEAYSGRSSSFSRLCQTFWTSSLSSSASSSLPISFSWSGSVRRVVVMGTMARSSERIS